MTRPALAYRLSKIKGPYLFSALYLPVSIGFSVLNAQLKHPDRYQFIKDEARRSV